MEDVDGLLSRDKDELLPVDWGGSDELDVPLSVAVGPEEPSRDENVCEDDV